MTKASAARTSGLLELTILGCGTSSGVPLIGCTCAVCRSRHPKNKRLRASVWVKTGGKSILVDTSSDLRQQALREKITHVDSILFTHPHSDHTSGIDDVRAFNFLQKLSIPAYGNAWTVRELRARYDYIFNPDPHYKGGGRPMVDLLEFDANVPHLNVDGVRVVPVPVDHGGHECVGFRFSGKTGDIAYLTDCSTIPESSRERLMGLRYLVLDCVRVQKHGTHLNVADALEIAAALRPEKTFLTHLGHDFDYATWTRRGPRARLPKNVTLAYDGLKIKV